ncbi:hypothetical protein CONLIGDRAFT_697288 [Coniochaeta ligniaria NRRL 30616]|uniref:Cytochrome c oxidase polypeptide II n=1 Tax=Coniochaeta ligniaria NRRL 30616 TaxID=1408157 RepID=A0A1J7J541_9PEZI|nr:hypothetical protein CONLIGDRAFT_697288 [Coniochaeta ligniaria NRRL 30616]
MQGLVELHNNIIYYLVIILNYISNKSLILHKYLNYVILILIAFPSFKLLYLIDEVSNPSISILAKNSNKEFIEFDSYIVPKSNLEEGTLRILKVDNKVILLELTYIRFIITTSNIIYSFTYPSLVSIFINREGVFYSQYLEIYSILYSSIPIVIELVSLEKFLI